MFLQEDLQWPFSFVILWFVMEKCFNGVDCFYRLFSES